MKYLRARTGTAFLYVLAMAALSALAASTPSQLASPAAKAICKFDDGKTIHVDYFSPRMRGRKIFGDLVPFGEEWRVGANDATAFVTTADLLVGGKSVPAGSYTVFALPTQSKWTLIISKLTGEWGIPYPGAQHDFARIDMKVSKLSAPLENFTISFDPGGSTCTMKFDWEMTRASISISEKK